MSFFFKLWFAFLFLCFHCLLFVYLSCNAPFVHSVFLPFFTFISDTFHLCMSSSVTVLLVFLICLPCLSIFQFSSFTWSFVFLFTQPFTQYYNWICATFFLSVFVHFVESWTLKVLYPLNLKLKYAFIAQNNQKFFMFFFYYHVSLFVYLYLAYSSWCYLMFSLFCLTFTFYCPLFIDLFCYSCFSPWFLFNDFGIKYMKQQFSHPPIVK